MYPVGDSCRITTEAGPGDYRVTRNLREGGPEGRVHQGADLSNGRGGDPVRAAAAGLVVRTGRTGYHRGFGRHVVLAHRFPEGSCVYSVYAHLAPKSIRVREGQVVHAGQIIGRVGMTGRATSPHLHFEIRVPDDPAERWERAAAVDPLLFIEEHLSARNQDTTWARTYLLWADHAGMLPPLQDSGAELRRRDWWRMLAAASRLPGTYLPAAPESLVVLLGDAGVLESEERGGVGGRVEWKEFARQLQRLQRRGTRLPPSPVGPAPRRDDLGQQLELGPEQVDLDQLMGRKGGAPTLAQACLAMAEVAGDPPKPKKKKAPAKPAPAKPAPPAPAVLTSDAG
jgi:hypothetical protein